MPKDAIAYLLAALTLIGAVLGVGRFVGKIEDRIEQLERQQRYLHGTIRLPEGVP